MILWSVQGLGLGPGPDGVPRGHAGGVRDRGVPARRELLDEVAKSKITGEEERYSHTDMVDFAANIDGAKEAFEQLEDALEKIDPGLERTIDHAFDAVRTSLDSYRDGRGADDFVSYGELSTSDLTGLARQVDALAEPLSQVAARIVGNG